MNRFNNVFNAASLGSGGVSRRVFMQAAQACRATCSAVIRAGRKLSSSISPTASLTGVLRVGGVLRGAIHPQAVVHARLLRRVALSASQSAQATVSAVLRRIHPENLQSQVSAGANWVGHKLSAGRKLAASLTVTAFVSGRLNMFCRARASVERTAYALFDARTIQVQGDYSMAVLKTHTKQPADRIDYDFDYSKWLTSGDEIATAVITVDQGSIVEGDVLLEVSGAVVLPTYVKAWVWGGTAGVTGKVTCTITTTHNRVKQDEIKIRVKEY